MDPGKLKHCFSRIPWFFWGTTKVFLFSGGVEDAEMLQEFSRLQEEAALSTLTKDSKDPEERHQRWNYGIGRFVADFCRFSFCDLPDVWFDWIRKAVELVLKQEYIMTPGSKADNMISNSAQHNWFHWKVWQNQFNFQYFPNPSKIWAFQAVATAPEAAPAVAPTKTSDSVEERPTFQPKIQPNHDPWWPHHDPEKNRVSRCQDRSPPSEARDLFALRKKSQVTVLFFFRFCWRCVVLLVHFLNVFLLPSYFWVW